MLRWLTAGESHGPALVAVLEGLPSHVSVTSGDIVDALARRRLGYGRGARMKFEQDEVEIIGGLRHGRTLVRMNLYWPDRIEKFCVVSLDGEREWHIRMQDRPEEQGPILDKLHEYVGPA